MFARERSNARGLVSAAELACFAYCPEQWRLQYGLKLDAENREALAAGDRHHARKAVAERLAGGSIVLGRILIAAGAFLVLWLLWGHR